MKTIFVLSIFTGFATQAASPASAQLAPKPSPASAQASTQPAMDFNLLAVEQLSAFGQLFSNVERQAFAPKLAYYWSLLEGQGIKPGLSSAWKRPFLTMGIIMMDGTVIHKKLLNTSTTPTWAVDGLNLSNKAVLIPPEMTGLIPLDAQVMHCMTCLKLTPAQEKAVAEAREKLRMSPS